MLQWLMDAARGEERTVKALVLRLLTVNIAAIHTSSLVRLFLSFCRIFEGSRIERILLFVSPP